MVVGPRASRGIGEVHRPAYVPPPEAAFRVATVTVQVVKGMNPLYAGAKPAEREEIGIQAALNELPEFASPCLIRFKATIDAPDHLRSCRVTGNQTTTHEFACHEGC